MADGRYVDRLWTLVMVMLPCLTQQSPEATRPDQLSSINAPGSEGCRTGLLDLVGRVGRVGRLNAHWFLPALH